jgi:hypothetical protein
MAIVLTGAGGLFTRIGRIGKLIYLANTHQAALPAAYDSLFDQFTSQPDRTWVRDLLDGYEGLLTIPVGGLSLGVADAQRILLEMVLADNPSAGTSIPAAVQEVITQMLANSDGVSECAVTSVATPLAGIQGTGVIVVGVLRGDGKKRQNLIAENAVVVCEIDSYSGGATAGQEQFRFTGAPLTADRLSYNWPDGSGASWPFLAIDAAAAADANGNLLTNSDFETFTVTNTPDNWAIEAGTAGTQILESSAAPYYGTKNIRFVGNATGAAISQTFNNTDGTSPTMLPEVNYALSFWGKITTAPAAGVLRIELTDSANTVIADSAGVNNQYNLTLSTAATVWTNYTAVFRAPKVIPTGMKLRVRLSTALSVASTLDLDHMALAQMQVPYPGGPNVAVFGGAVAFSRGDGWTVADTNDRNSALYLATWNGLMDRLFQMRENGLQLPFRGSPTVLDSLITS